MKIFRLVIIFILVAAMLCGCSAGDTDTVEQNDSAEGSYSSIDISNSDNYNTDICGEDDDSDLFSENDFPLTCGAYVYESIDAAARSVVFGIPYEDLSTPGVFSDLFSSCSYLADGSADVVFTSYIYDYERDEAEQSGIELVEIPVARDGIVFFVSCDNPIESISEDDLRKVFSGEITNWNELGGDDLTIECYQHNELTVAYCELAQYMNGREMVDVLQAGNYSPVWFPDGAALPFDGQIAGIGYCPYSQFDIYEGYSKIKVLKVDGIEPSSVTIVDNSYPCCAYVNAVIRKNDAADYPIKNFIDLLLSESIQNQILLSDVFAPLTKIDNYTHIDKSDSCVEIKGTGKSVFENDLYFCYGMPKTKEMSFNGYSVKLPYFDNELIDNEVESYVSETVNTVLEKCNPTYIRCDCRIINGFLSVSLVIPPEYDGDFIKYGAVWEISSCKRMHLSDLFRLGADFMPLLNVRISEYIESTSCAPYSPFYVKLGKAFDGIPLDFNNFYLDCETFEQNGMNLVLSFNSFDYDWLESSINVALNIYNLEDCVLNEKCDVSEYCLSPKEGRLRHIIGTAHSDGFGEWEVGSEDTDVATYYGESITYIAVFEKYGASEIINESVIKYVDEHRDLRRYIWAEDTVNKAFDYFKEDMVDYYGIDNPTVDDFVNKYMSAISAEVTVTAEEYGEQYATVCYRTYVRYGEQRGTSVGIVFDENIVSYDLSTGEVLK